MLPRMQIKWDTPNRNYFKEKFLFLEQFSFHKGHFLTQGEETQAYEHSVETFFLNQVDSSFKKQSDGIRFSEM